MVSDSKVPTFFILWDFPFVTINYTGIIQVYYNLLSAVLQGINKLTRSILVSSLLYPILEHTIKRSKL